MAAPIPKQQSSIHPRHDIIPSEYPYISNSDSRLAGNFHHNPQRWVTTETLETPLFSTTFPPAPDEATVRPLACAAWALVLAQFTGRDNACFGILSVGSDGEPFVETFVADCASTLTVGELVDCAKKDQAFNDQGQDTTALPLRSYLSFSSDPTTNTGGADWPAPDAGALLVISLAVNSRTVSLRACFNSLVVKGQEIRNVMGVFAEVFHQVASPELQNSALGDLNFLTPEDKSLINRWNEQELEPVNKLLHILFEEAAEANTKRVALLFRGQAITYAELDTLSSKLACRLRHGGDLFAEGNFIPISIEKSPEMIIAMIGILKAGKAFVPLDQAYPKARRGYILALLGAKGVLVSGSVDDAPLFDFTVEKLDERGLCQSTDHHHQQHPQSMDSTHPTYVLFTSGSTGVPKGVVVEHRNVSTAMTELGRRFNLNQQTRMFQYTSPAFDPSILEVFGTLIHGGCVCIPTETQRLNDIPGAINEMRVNTAVFVPSVLKLLHPEQIPTAEKLIIGGEALPQALVDLWAPRVQLINAYGPTETCVCSVANLRVGPGKYRGSIGTPIACRAWVVDPWNPRRLMHIGAVGELWIQGPIVARGYLRDEAATRTSFFASPMPWSDSGSPANGYRTGDLVRQLPDGALAFLGRKDKQIKLDGHRIEPEEVEAVIRLTGLVSNASVQLITTTDSSSPTLAAFVVPAGVECSNDDRCELSRRIESNSSVTSRLGEILKAQLPARMIPQYMIAVTCIPRLTSGKVDQRHLTKLFEDEIQDGHHHTACRSRFECNSAHHENSERHAAMRDLWSQALEVPPHHICANARFLHLGGNSIKAMKLVAAARSSGLVLTVSDVLGKSYTLDEMARTMKPVEPVSATPAMVVIQAPRQRRSTYAPTWIQAVSVTTVGAFPEGNYTRIVVDLRGPLDLARLYKAFQCLVARNEILRTQYSLKDGGIEATVLDASEISTPLVPLASLSDAVQHWESAPATSCFDRQLVDFTYVTLSESSARFALGLQHSQYDAWTVPLLLRQLQSLYQQPGSDELASLRPPGPPFSEYATRLARESHNPEAERFWKKLLEGVSMTILSNKETDGVTGDVDADEPDGHFHHSFRLPTSRFTPATIVYTAWALVLAQHTQKTTKTSKVIFGGAVSGRNIDMDGILDVVGPCINMIPFAVDAFGGSSRRNRTYLAALQTVQEAMLATVPYEAMPMPEIIARCTNWDPAGVFGSIVQHLDISFDIPLLAPSSTLEWKFVETRKHYGRCRATDIYIFSSTGTEGGKRTMEVQFKFNPSRVAPLLAQVLFDDLCGHIEAMGRDPAKKISIGL